MADDERRAEIEAVGLAMRVKVREAPHVPTWDELAGVAIAELDRLRDARGDDEAPRCDECGHLWSRHRGTVCLDCEAARSPQGEDHEAAEYIPCPHCGGQGVEMTNEDGGAFRNCASCKGSGRILSRVSPSGDGTVAVEDVVRWFDGLNPHLYPEAAGYGRLFLAEFSPASTGDREDER